MLAGWSLAAHLRGKGVLSFNYAVFKVLCKPNARVMYERLEEADDPDNPDPETRTYYTNKWTVDDLEAVVRKSLSFLNTDVATESMRQKFLQSLGTLRRKASQNVRYTPIIDRYFTLSTRHRQSDSVSAAELRHTKTIFYTDQTRASLINGKSSFLMK
jgi:type III restriction enzyme